ncbi:MAG: penicillin acylase family protein, partial [Myxococcales bacterium]|nr:penicillin acylase family protein [Myxococcales bacterium]
RFGGFTIPTDDDGHADEAQGESDPYRCVIPFDAMPQSLNPPDGFVRTANNQPAPIDDDGDSANDTWYLGGPWESVRADTIRKRLEAIVAAGDATAADMSSVQADRRSSLGGWFTPALLDAIDRAKTVAGSGAELTAEAQRLVDLYKAKAARFDEARSRLAGWTFDAPSGVETFYEAPTDAERADAVATMIFNAWLPRFVQSVWGDEPSDDLFPFRPDYTRWATILAFLDGRGAGNPKQLASWDAETGESVFFDRIGTPEKEHSDELMLAALGEALDALEAAPAEPGHGGFGTADMAQWLWGLRHLVRFDSLIAAVGSDPALAVFTSLFSITTDTLPLADSFPAGDPRKDLEHFPRGGDNFSVDAAEHGDDAEDFTYDTGPVMRMVIALGDETT